MSQPCNCGGEGLGAGGFHYPGGVGCRVSRPPPALTIYVAGASADRDMIATFVAELRAAGWTVTHDWTDPAFFHNEALSVAERAIADHGGVLDARILWYVAPEVKSEGSHFELGIAVAERRRDRLGARTILTSGPIWDHNRIFPSLGNRHFAEHHLALAWLIRHAQEQRAALAGAR